ncbi:MAG: DUF2752 domain-containing protein [Chitinophagaceae bacterium]
MYQQFIHWLIEHQLTCPFKSITRLPCPGCGAQSSFIALLQGKLIESFVLYPPLFPMMAYFIFSVYAWASKHHFPKKVFLLFYWIIALSVVISYIIKLQKAIL